MLRTLRIIMLRRGKEQSVDRNCISEFKYHLRSSGKQAIQKRHETTTTYVYSLYFSIVARKEQIARRNIST